MYKDWPHISGHLPMGILSTEWGFSYSSSTCSHQRSEVIKTVDTERRRGRKKERKNTRYLFRWDAVELRQQPEPIFLFDEDAFQSLLVLLDLGGFTEIIRLSRVVQAGMSKK